MPDEASDLTLAAEFAEKWIAGLPGPPRLIADCPHVPPAAPLCSHTPAGKGDSMRILVTGASTFFAVRLIHDLGLRGAEVTAADSLRLSPGRLARYTTHGIKLPPLGRDPGGYIETILSELERRPYDLLVPTFEESLLLAEYRHELARRTRVFLPEFGVMQRLHHKPSLHHLCLELGLASPPTVVPHGLDGLRRIAPGLHYPVVVKLPTANNSVGRSFCETQADLLAKYEKLATEQTLRGDEPPFVQRKIDGDLVFVLLFCHEGRKAAELVYRTRRTFPSGGGTAVHRETIVRPEISRAIDRLVAATGWTGFLGLDFIVDHKTQIPYLIDANPRLTPALHLGYLAGIDWTQLLFDVAAGIAPRVQTARPGVHAHNLMMDIGWLFEGLFSWRGATSFLRKFRQFLSPPWPLDSRDDLLGRGELSAALTIGLHAVTGLFQSLLGGRELGQVLLEHANYDARTAAAYRAARGRALPAPLTGTSRVTADAA